MNILLFGITNVGKSTIGSILANKLNYDFYDVEEAIENNYEGVLESFEQSIVLSGRDKVRGIVTKSFAAKPGNKVISVPPIYYMRYVKPAIIREDSLTIVLEDTPENIFKRAVLLDSEGNISNDEEFKNKHKKIIMKEIKKRMSIYLPKFRSIPEHVDINGLNAEEAAMLIIETYGL